MYGNAFGMERNPLIHLLKLKTMGQTIICRTSFCPYCLKAGRPHIGDMFFAHGSYNDKFHIRYAGINGIPGFTPFNYRIIKVIGENIILERSCAMLDCGINFWVNNDKAVEFFIRPEAWQRLTWPLTRWNGLVLWKNDKTYFI